MDELGTPFRATKDLDIVLIIEALDTSFGEMFWKFIEDGGYEHREKNRGENQLYRFTEPTRSGYPKMIELFSRKPCNLMESHLNVNIMVQMALYMYYFFVSILTVYPYLLNK